MELSFSSQAELEQFLAKHHCKNIEELNRLLDHLGKQTRDAFNRGDWKTAEQYIQQGLAIIPEHSIMLSDLAFAKNQQNQPQAAYEVLMRALKSSTSMWQIFSGLTNACFSLNRYEEALYYARKCLALKKKEAEVFPAFPLPKGEPKGLSSDPKRNIISYSLFGDNPRYCEIAVMNTQLAKQIYPEWTCRFYLDNSVPPTIVERLIQNGAEVIFVPAEWKAISGLFWRFFVVEDPSVQCFIIRDADSLLSYKERAAVDQWLCSKKWFHIMRDGINHCELILAGMWGGYTGVFYDIFSLIQTVLSEQFIRSNGKIIDQSFLRTQIYPTVSQSVLIHDTAFLEENSIAFPFYPISDIEKVPDFHIGMIEAHHRFVFPIEIEDVKRICWRLLDSQNQEVCSYETEVPSSRQIELILPYTYVQKIQTNQYRLNWTKIA